MNDRRKSDSSVVPRKPSNEIGRPIEEEVEGRGLAKGNLVEHDVSRTQSRTDAHSALERVRQAARRDRKQRFTALLHHVYAIERLRSAYLAVKRDATAGIDGETWRHYGENLESNLQDLSERLKRGAYRAKPVRRAYIAKSDGRQRPLGVPTLEDKIVQRSVVEVLNAIYETDFIGFSYGFRPSRSAHLALDALAVGIGTRKVSWVLDADIRDFFGTLRHEWLLKFIEHRIGDQRVVRLVQKWLNAGVLESGIVTCSEVGTVQGGSVSPLLANIYLHYVFDLWVRRWREKRTHGDVIVVRYADDFVVGFQHRSEAESFQAELRERFAAFGLSLHSEKTRLIEFGRFASRDRQRRGLRKPETFSFLGFTHISGRTRAGHFTVIRRTMRARMQAKLKGLRVELMRRRHATIPELGRWLASVVRGHAQYYGVPLNYRAIERFRTAVGRTWKRALERRSETARIKESRMSRLIAKWLPPTRICHPYPLVRLGVMTQGKSRMR